MPLFIYYACRAAKVLARPHVLFTAVPEHLARRIRDFESVPPQAGPLLLSRSPITGSAAYPIRVRIRIYACVSEPGSTSEHEFTL